MEVTSVLQAPVSWAQRKDRLYITINVEDCTDIHVQFGEKSVTFRATSKSGEHEYVANLDLFDKINVSSCRYVVFSRQIPMVVKKLHKGPYWPRLLSTTAKVHWVKTDFNKWKDENDSDIDDDSHRHNAEFEDMMHLMGNMGT